MRKLIVPAMSALLITGCATWGQLDKGLQSLHGQPLSVAISKIGYPSGERQIAGMRLISWSSSNSGVVYLPQSSTTYGTAYSPYRGYTNYSATTSYMSPTAYNYSCEITLQVDEKNIIQASQYQGNLGGCGPYINALKQPNPFFVPTSTGGVNSTNQNTKPLLEQDAAAKKLSAATARSDYLLCVKNAMKSGSSDAALQSCEPLAAKHREAAFSLSIASNGKDPFTDATAADILARQEAAKIAASTPVGVRTTK